MRYIFFCIIFLSAWGKGQIIEEANQQRVADPSDTLIVDNGGKDSVKIFQPTIEDYKWKTQKGEYQIFDTVFTPEKTFVFSQFNNRDNFGKIQFPNIGQPFNPLVYEPNPEMNLAVLPTGKSFGILGVDDIPYYDVKTPTTFFEFHNSVGTGADLNSNYTQNIGKNFNFAINYMGLRSKGDYKRNLSVNNHFNFSAHYTGPEKRYELYAHYLNQNVNNEENGGIKVLDQYLGDDTRFKNRLNMEVNLENTETFFTYRRYYLNHDFGLFKINESYPLKIRHQFKYEISKYYYDQKQIESYFATEENPAIRDYPLSSKKYSDKLTNVVSLVFDREKFKLDAGLKYQNIILGVNNIFLNDEIEAPKWSENRIGAEGNLKIKLWDRFDLDSHAEYTTGKTFGNFIKIDNQLSAIPVEGIEVNAKLNFLSSAPSFNYLMNGSVYSNFNYLFSDFKQQSVLEAGGSIKSQWLGASAFINYFHIGNYTYIDSNYRPQQASSLNISQIGGEATWDYNKFHINGRVLFQSTINNKEILPLPNFIARASVYYQSKMFKDAAEVQAGIKGYYFNKFATREFSPVLNEFILPGSDSYSIGGYPMADVFINLKVKSMMVFAEAKYLNGLIKNHAFAAPFYPLTDFRVNIGIVWYIFT